ncbi:MAG: caspase family protein [Rhodocyclales bacterium]|nr:caspase family protein [Rhodocyclales bacterium]
MIERHALIIECSEIVGQEPLPGARRDADNWNEFLLSNRGGLWRTSEISMLRNPSSVQVKSAIARMTSGYGFVTFSGHGYVSAQTRETMVCLQGGNLSEIELTPNSPRATVILDSCRGIYEVAFAEALAVMKKAAGDDVQFRFLFDAALERAEMGICRAYGCSFNQAAQESKAGGYFTQALIQAGKNWAGPDALSLRNAFDSAASTLRRKAPQQTPEAEMGRRLNHFPFSVHP